MKITTAVRYNAGPADLVRLAGQVADLERADLDGM